MPGSIHLSVIEWLDVPSEESISIPHFLKVYMGKKEFRSIGKESFSFPVISLRDNIMVMLSDINGNLVTKTELRTILIAEKGETEVVFPLGYGKDVKLRLKFILSEEEKEKIREMRNLALKRKHDELLKSTHEPGSSAMQGTKDYMENGTKKVTKRLQETDQTTIKEQIKSLTMVPQSISVDAQKSPLMVGEDNPINQKQKSLIIVKQDSQIEEQKPLTMVKELDNTIDKSLVLMSKKENMIEERTIFKEGYITDAKKLLTVVKESSPVKEYNSLTMVKQEPLIHEEHKPLTMVKLKGTGNTIEKQNVNEENKSLTMVKKPKLENINGGDKRKSIERSSSGSIRKMISAFESNSNQKPGPHIGWQITKIPSQNSFEDEDIQQDRRISQTLSRRSFSSGNLSEASLQNDPDFAHIPLINEKIMFISNEREDLPPEFEEGTQFNETMVCVSNLNEENNERHDIREAREIRFLRNYEKFTKDYSNNSFQIFDINTPRHWCLTTGPKQLRNVIDNFSINLTSDKEQKLDGVELEEESTEVEIKNQARRNFGNSILNGLLIDKGARILIVIIAFGTIIFQSR